MRWWAGWVFLGCKKFICKFFKEGDMKSLWEEAETRLDSEPSHWTLNLSGSSGGLGWCVFPGCWKWFQWLDGADLIWIQKKKKLKTLVVFIIFTCSGAVFLSLCLSINTFWTKCFDSEKKQILLILLLLFWWFYLIWWTEKTD